MVLLKIIVNISPQLFETVRCPLISIALEIRWESQLGLDVSRDIVMKPNYMSVWFT